MKKDKKIDQDVWEQIKRDSESEKPHASGNGEKKHGKKKILRLVLIILAVYLAVIAVAAVLVDARHVRFYLAGQEEITLEYGQPYSEPGVRAVTVGRLFGESGRELHVETQNNIDASRLGRYEIVYTVRYGFSDYSTSRAVTVVDTTPPKIELKHIDGHESTWFTGYEEEGYTATDNFDGDLTAKVTRTEETDRVIYTVTDSSGNRSEADRELNLGDAAPVIRLRGDSDISINASMNFSDPGFEAVDGLGNDVSSLVTVSGEVIPYTAGSYELVYSITNSRGDIVSATRTVTVVPANNPDTVDPNSKTIYLTFDDGPGPYTGQLLDVLSKYNAKATFFVTGALPKYFDQIGRASREGHSIGVHTYSHNYKDIYSSEEAFFKDFNAVESIIYDQTGSYTSICRFPGGSSNTVSNFNPGIISRLAASLGDMGYTYFDWNVSSGDAGETTKTSKIVDNITGSCSNRKISVVLQHDIKDYSVAAVEQVILWGLNNGYTFRALDQSSPTAHHSIAN